ncbi:MAG: GtrA family protein [Halonotius sp.]
MVRSLLRSLVSGPLARRLRRFVIVGVIGAGVQIGLLWLFVDIGGVNYLLGALFAIEFTIVLAYVLNNAWTFQTDQHTSRMEYLTGLARTNVVRGTAIPIQLGILYAFVEWAGLLYLVANGAAIFLTGLYRYVLEARWTWG